MNRNLTFENLPAAVAQLLERVNSIERLLIENKSNVPDTFPNKPLTTKQLCCYLDIAEATIIRWRQKNKIPYLQVGGSIRYDLKSVVEALKVNGGAKRI